MNGPRRHQTISEDYQQRSGHSYQHPGQSQIRGPIHPQAHLQHNPTLSPHDMNPYQAISSQSRIPQQGHEVAMAHAMMIHAQPRPQDSGTPDMTYLNYCLSRNLMQQQGSQVIQRSVSQHRNPMQMGMDHLTGLQQNFVSVTNPVDPTLQGYQQQYAGHPSATAYNQSVYFHQNPIESAVQAFEPIYYPYRHPGTHMAATPQQQPPTYFTQPRNQLSVTNAVQAFEPIYYPYRHHGTHMAATPQQQPPTYFTQPRNQLSVTNTQAKKAVKRKRKDPKGVASLALSKDGEGERTNVSETISPEIEVDSVNVEEEAASAQEGVAEVPIVGSDSVVEQPKEIEVGGASTSVTSTGGLQMATANSTHETSLPGPSNRRENDSQILILDHPTITTICEMCPAMVAIDQLATHIRILHIIPSERYYNRVIANLLPDAARGA